MSNEDKIAHIKLRLKELQTYQNLNKN